MWVKSIEILKSLGGAVETHLIKWQQKNGKKIGIQRQKRFEKKKTAKRYVLFINRMCLLKIKFKPTKTKKEKKLLV